MIYVKRRRRKKKKKETPIPKNKTVISCHFQQFLENQTEEENKAKLES